MAGAPGPAAQLGLGGAVASAQLKLLAALPAQWQDDARRVGARFHLDPVGWYRNPERPDRLPAMAQAVWNEQRVRIRYESWKGVVDRIIEPLGLVMKAGEWYVVAFAAKAPRTYKLSNILALEAAGGKFTRPRKFDLARHWAESIERFEAGLYRATATLRASTRGLKALRHLSAAVSDAVDRAPAKRDRHGWARVTIPIESVDHAAAQILGTGAECEVIEPAALRARLAQAAVALAAIYRPKR
jgi:predicted DNA-binding transcriptional regulator YafY